MGIYYLYLNSKLTLSSSPSASSGGQACEGDQIQSRACFLKRCSHQESDAPTTISPFSHGKILSWLTEFSPYSNMCHCCSRLLDVDMKWPLDPLPPPPNQTMNFVKIQSSCQRVRTQNISIVIASSCFTKYLFMK